MEEKIFNIKISKEDQPILSIDKFDFVMGRINFLLGESGIGKTMISKAIFGILDPNKFLIEINNSSYNSYLDDIGYIQDGFFVFQEPSSHLNPMLKIGTQLKEGNLGTGKNEINLLNELWQKSDKEQFLPLLKVYPKPYRPSGGEKQRFLLVMALKKIDRYLESDIEGIPLFIFDEPTGSLDDELRNWFVDALFKKYRQKPFTILFITHDYSIISEVVSNNSDLYDIIYFKELQRNNKKLLLRKFNEQHYLRWINNSKNNLNSISQNKNNCLLSLNSGIEVFNKNISILNRNGIETPLKIHKNEIVYLKAPSGVGKTTVAKIISGLIQANKFEFTIQNELFNQSTPLKNWKNKLWGKLITMTFQHADEALNLNSTVRQTLLNLPRKKRPNPKNLIQKLQLIFEGEINESLLIKKNYQLSGGQKQRINLLRAFLLQTPILILDEPLNGLDFTSIKKIVDLIINYRDSGHGILIISHNEEIMESIVEPDSIYYLIQN